MSNEFNDGRDMQWRYTAETPRFVWVIDARTLLPLLLFLLHMQWWTLQLAFASVAGFGLLGLWRITPGEALKALWLWIVTLAFRWGHVGYRIRRYHHG